MGERSSRAKRSEPIVPAPAKSGRPGRVVAVASTVVCTLVFAWTRGAFDGLSDSEVFRERIQSWGVWGPVLFVVAMWVVQPFGVPGVVFMVPASLVWSTPVACALSWMGNMGSSWLAFEFTRRVGHAWVRGRIPPRLQRFDHKIAAGGVWPVFALRVFTGQIPPADWLLGVSSVRRAPFLIGTGLGIIPGIVLIVVYGADVLDWLRDHPLAAVALLVAAISRRVVGNRRREAGDIPYP